jgi:DNA polymerase V
MALTQVLGRVLPSGVRVPFYACRVSAGFPSPADDFAEAALSLDELTEIRAPSTYLVRAGGDSMIERGIYCGDVLVVNRALDAVSGDVVIASVDGEFTVKELSWRPGQRPMLVPANPKYPPICINDGEEFDLFGVATYCLHRLRR